MPTVKYVPNTKPFTKRQKLACDFLLKGLDPKLSLKQAGYSDYTQYKPYIIFSAKRSLNYLKKNGLEGSFLHKLEKQRNKTDRNYHENKNIASSRLKISTYKQKKLCDAYLVFGDVAIASRLAGYSKSMNAYESLCLPASQQYLRSKRNMYEEDLIATFRWRTKKLAKLIESIIPEEGDIDKHYSPAAIAAIKTLNDMFNDSLPSKPVELSQDEDIRKINEVACKILERKNKEREEKFCLEYGPNPITR